MFDTIPKNINKGYKMLIEQKKKVELTALSFRIEKVIVDEFKILCKKYNVSQTTVIRNAMKKAIEEMNEL